MALAPSGGDDTAQMRTALAAGDVELAAGTYPVGYITHTGGSRSITALGPVTIVQTDARGVFDLRGGWDILGPVSGVSVQRRNLVAAGESAPTSSDSFVSELALPAGVTVARGDVVKVVSDDLQPFGRRPGPGGEFRQGEYSTVGRDSSGLAVTLTNVLVESYVTNVRAAKLRDVSFTVDGPVTFDTSPLIRDTSIYGVVLSLRAARGCYVGPQVRFRNSLGRAIANYTYCSRFDGVEFRNLANRPSKNHWGYGVQDGGWMTRMSGCHGENLRHLYSEGANVVAASSPDFEFFGGGWFGLITDCTAMGCQSQAFDTHGTAYGTVFDSCRAYGTYVGASSGGPGFSLRGRRVVARNCDADGCFRGFGVHGHQCRLDNCRATRTRYQALTVSGDSSDAAHQKNLSMEIRGGFYECDDYVNAGLGSAGWTIDLRMEDVVLVQNTVPGGGARAAQLEAGLSLRFKRLRWHAPSTAGVRVGLSANHDSVKVVGDGLEAVNGSAGCTLVGHNWGVGQNASMNIKNAELGGAGSKPSDMPNVVVM